MVSRRFPDRLRLASQAVHDRGSPRRRRAPSRSRGLHHAHVEPRVVGSNPTPALGSYHRGSPEARTREGRSMMKRFIVGMFILGGIIAAAMVIMRRRAESDVGWDEFVSDTS